MSQSVREASLYDDSLALQAWFHLAGPLWLGGGVAGMGTMGTDHPSHAGVLLDISAMLELQPIETQLRLYIEHEWAPNELTLFRVDVRSTLPGRLVPIARLVIDHVPQGWDQEHPHETRWDFVPYGGGLIRLGGTARHPVAALGGMLGVDIPRVSVEPLRILPMVFVEIYLLQ